MRLVVATSTVADGSMYDRNTQLNDVVIKNRERFLAAHAISVGQATRLRVEYDRVDFCRYREVTSADKDTGMRNHGSKVADAIITKEKNHALFLPIADCVGAVIYDSTHHILALVHLGRHSLEQQGGQKIVAHLVREYSSKPADLQVWLTPAVGKESYLIWALENKGMKEASLEQLCAAGIDIQNITNNTAETDTDPNYFSYSSFLLGSQHDDGDHAIVAMMAD
jgi:copper oxidase (laccase) domain-containing protein